MYRNSSRESQMARVHSKTKYREHPRLVQHFLVHTLHRVLQDLLLLRGVHLFHGGSMQESDVTTRADERYTNRAGYKSSLQMFY